MTNKVLFISPHEAEQAFYQAMAQADLDALMNVWSEDEDIACVFPGGARYRGYSSIREAWQSIFQAGQRLELVLSQVNAVSNPFTLITNVLEDIRIIGQEQGNARMYSTNVFIRSPIGWRLTLRHSSRALEESVQHEKTEISGQILSPSKVVLH